MCPFSQSQVHHQTCATFFLSSLLFDSFSSSTFHLFLRSLLSYSFLLLFSFSFIFFLISTSFCNFFLFLIFYFFVLLFHWAFSISSLSVLCFLSHFFSILGLSMFLSANVDATYNLFLTPGILQTHFHDSDKCLCSWALCFTQPILTMHLCVFT